MTGSNPPWKRRFRRSGADGVPPDGVRDDERGLGASLEAADAGMADALETIGDAPWGHPQAPEAPGEGREAPLTKRRTTALRDGVRQGVRKGGSRARAFVGYLTDRVIENAPRVPVRDLATLRKQFPGLGPEELADKLVSGAANATSTVGAGIGAAAMMPVPPAMPAELAAEITGVAAIELKLVAELHEVYGLRPPGGLKDRTAVYLTSWAEERGVDVTKPSTINVALGGQMKREMRQQITKRLVRNMPNLMPFMVGAAVGALMNRRDTKKLAGHIRKDLRKAQRPWPSQGQTPDDPGRPALPGQ
ncbi:hypothetical protein ACWCP6_22435 [Streptomyces sp. NPDC002004]